MKRKKMASLFRVAGFLALFSAAVIALAVACGMCEDSGVSVVLALFFELMGLMCLGISRGAA